MRPVFANLDGLVRLSHTKGVDIRRPLLRVLTDLYVQEPSHSREEEQQYVELALRLAPAVDYATRAAVARKLAAYPHAPVSIIAALVRDAPELAKVIADPRMFAASPAGASPADPATTDTGIENANGTAAEVPESFASFEPLATDGSTPSRRLGEAFLRAGSSARIDMLYRLDDAEIVAAATALHLSVRPETSERLERAARGRDQREFVRELQRSLGISSRCAWRIVQDESGEPVLVAAKALGISQDVIERILLFLNPAVGESVERVFALSRLYERLTGPSAAPIVLSWREEGAARPGSNYQPLHAPDGVGSLASGGNARSAREPLADRTTRRSSGSDVPLRVQGTT